MAKFTAQPKPPGWAPPVVVKGPPMKPGGKATPVKPHALLDRFNREYVAYHKISAQRGRQQRRLLLEFEATLDGRRLDQAEYADLQGFAGDLMARDYHVNTIRKKLNQIRPFYSWAYAAGIIDAERYVSLRNVKDPRGATPFSEPNPYTRAELTLFWCALDEAWPMLPASGIHSRALRRWEKGFGPWGRVWKHAMRLQIDAMIRLALDCGLRRSEIFRLSLEDMHYDNDYLVVWRAGKGARAGVRYQQSVPFTRQARQAVYTWVEFRAKMNPEHDRPWLSCYGNAATQPMWDTRFDSLLYQTIGPEWAWHRFRHTAATNWLRAGMELEIVSRLLGHASLQQTLCYARIVEGDIQKHIDKYEDAFDRAVGPGLAA